MEYQSPEINEIAKALCEVQGEIDAAPKNAKNTVGGGTVRRYADINAVYSAIRDTLKKNGLSIVQTMRPSELNTVCVRTMLMHISGQWIAGECVLPCDRQNGPQGAGSAITYARRYSLSAMIGVVSEEDDDGDIAQPKVKRQSKEKTQENKQLATPSQVKRIQILLQNVGVKEREERIGRINTWLSRGGLYPIESTKELTSELASDLIKALEKASHDAHHDSPMVECPKTCEDVSINHECQKCDKKESDCPHWVAVK